MRRPVSIATSTIVGAGFFVLHDFETSNTEGQKLAAELGTRPRAVTTTGSVVSEPKIAPTDSQHSC